MLIQWNGSKWVGNDIPDFNTAPPGSNTGPFIMQQEGLGRLFALDKLAEGPFPEHYEPMETPLGTNPLHPNVVSSPVVRLYEEDAIRLGKKDKFPYVGTTYRLTEHFHTWTKHALLNSIAQPEQFVEISEGLAKSKGIANGDWGESQQQTRVYSRGCRGDPPTAHVERQRPAGRNRWDPAALGL
ncbi:formate dehydrogenase-N alpha subunit [Klebsiella variicola]|uniref:Formate dehydrogenase-N alpha subunit n=1 Tax=Klebsiella variicola TaxID=244366 RepID=A0A7H4MKW5_KLEVA|nr:formate dehydrogenase-N alpha subunit [Klebsiella variicola]